MANRASFTPEEWTKVLESVAVTGMAVTAAEPSGLWGMLKEALAGGAALAAAKADPNANELVKAAIADFETPEGRAAVQEALKHRFEGAKAADVVPRALDDVAPGLGNSRCQGPGRCASLQGLAQRHCRQGGGGLEGGRFSRFRRRTGERGREGDACRDRRGAWHERACLTALKAGEAWICSGSLYSLRRPPWRWGSRLATPRNPTCPPATRTP